MGLPAIFIIYTVSYGTIGDTPIPLFGATPLLEHGRYPKTSIKGAHFPKACQSFPRAWLSKTSLLKPGSCLPGLLPGLLPGFFLFRIAAWIFLFRIAAWISTWNFTLITYSLDHSPGLDFCSRYPGVLDYFAKYKSAFLKCFVYETPVQPLRLWLG